MRRACWRLAPLHPQRSRLQPAYASALAEGSLRRAAATSTPGEKKCAQSLALHCDIGNNVPMKQSSAPKKVQRVQIGARMEKTLVKTLKALAEYLDLSFGDLLEGITLHALEGKPPFSKQTLSHVKKLKTIYRLELTARDSHRLVEEDHAGG
jgi:hypothetical protein